MGKRAGKAKSATVAMGFVTGMLAGMTRAGRDPVPLLTAAGIAPTRLADPDARIPLAAYADLYNRVAAALDDEAFGLFSAPLHCGSFELLARALVSAHSLEEALQRLARFLRVLLPDMTVNVERQGSHARLRIVEIRPLAIGNADPADPGRVFAFEWLLRLIHGLACWLAGRGLALDAVDFPYPRPHHAADYALIYTANSHFDAITLEARFQANLLDLPLRRDEAALAAFLVGAPGRIATLYRRDRDTVLAVRDLLRDALPALPGLDTVAAHLHLSPRSLHRHLAEEGANFRQIKDALRRDLALARLAKTDTPVATIAAELGYADPSAFYRAFIDWTGAAPSDYRARLAGRG
ncbi:MAG: AraC family transcriptional regulator [Rhodocyclaceae bacterium]|nr:AraC family transcriptional regulator [Rhodocyclaceae bacterium]